MALAFLTLYLRLAVCFLTLVQAAPMAVAAIVSFSLKSVALAAPVINLSPSYLFYLPTGL